MESRCSGIGVHLRRNTHLIRHWLSGRGVPRRLAGLETAQFLENVATKPERIFLIAVPADAVRIMTLQTAARGMGDSVEGWLRDVIEGKITGRHLS